MQRATDDASESDREFLDNFKARGWFLDVGLGARGQAGVIREKGSMPWGCKKPLAQRIGLYQPMAIVSLLVSMRKIVEKSASQSRQHRQTLQDPISRNRTTVAVSQVNARDYAVVAKTPAFEC
jgi:hypothetical protein